MRERLFRGKRVGNGGWAYGYYKYSKILDEHIIVGDDCVSYTVIPETVGQYIELDDKNGVKIFEGDVVQEFAGEHAQGVWEYSNVSVVEDLRWIPESLGFADCTYIIGNIHDNPELTEAKKKIDWTEVEA